MIKVMIAGRHRNIREKLKNYLETDEELEMTGEASGMAEALIVLENLMPDVLLLHAGENDPDAISLTERVTQSMPRTFLIVFYDTVDLETLQAVNAAGCHNVFLFPENAGELSGCVHRVYNTELGRLHALSVREKLTVTSRAIAVYGAKGGLGKTTLAVNIAVKLAKLGKRVALIDMDLQFGDVSTFLDLDPKDTISDLMQDMHEVSVDSVRSYMSVHSSGVHVLAAPKSPEYAEMVDPERLQALFRILKTAYDFVIIDCPSDFSDTTMSALEASSMIMFLTGLDVSILKNSKIAMNILETLGQKQKVRSVINRAVDGNAIRLSDVEAIIDAPIIARIPSDYMTAVAALNRGQPFVQCMPKTKLSLSIGDVALRLIENDDSFDLRKFSNRERRRLIRKYQVKDRSEKPKGLFSGRKNR